MKLHVLRFSSQSDSTLGLLFEEDGDKRNFLSYTLEDEHRDEKVMHETRIPNGTYEITLRTTGGFHARYAERFPDIHKGMLWVRDVPGFEYILIHCGNNDDHTSGCLLLGNSQKENITQNGFIGASSDAYKRVYPRIAKAILEGECVEITYTDFDSI
jgi:hypothetical protein